MFAVRNKETGKFLKAFNGSFNHAEFHVRCAIAEEMLGIKKTKDREQRNRDSLAVVNKLRDVKWSEIIERMWCLDTPNNAQLYKTESAVISSIGDHKFIEIVPVISVEKGFKDGKDDKRHRRVGHTVAFLDSLAKSLDALTKEGVFTGSTWGIQMSARCSKEAQELREMREDW